MTLFCKCCPSWQRTSTPTSASVRRRALRRRKLGVFGSADRPGRCRRTITAPTSGGRLERSLVRQRRRSAECLCLPFDTGQRFTKTPSYCKRGISTGTCTFLQIQRNLRLNILYQKILDFTRLFRRKFSVKLPY